MRFQARFLGYLDEFTAAGHDVLLRSFADFETEFVENGLQIRVSKKKWRVWSLPFSLHESLKKERPDVILVHGLRWPIQVFLLKKQLGPAVKICLIQHAEQPPAAFLKRLVFRFADQFVDGYFFSSKGNAEAWLELKLISSASKICEANELSTHFQRQNRLESRQKLGFPASQPLILWVGRLHPNKDPLTILRGFELFLSRKTGAENPPLLLFIFQTTELLPEMEAILNASPGLKKQVRLVGKIAHDELETWFSAADFFTLGSHYEGSGTALTEAMACGCVPIVSDIASFRTILGDERAGFLFERGSSTAYSYELEAVLSVERNEFCSRVRAHFEANLSWKAIASRMLEFFKNYQRP